MMMMMMMMMMMTMMFDYCNHDNVCDEDEDGCDG